MILGLADADVGGRLGIGAAHMLMSLLQPTTDAGDWFRRGNMNTLQRLSGLFRHSKFASVTLSGGVSFLYDGIDSLMRRAV